ncbi:MAG: citramalate synthase [Deltaproteobacteria bacterium]|nr:citramalate synthase [Deltaproteobacteria bacterium]
MKKQIQIYDTTLRDGSQAEEVNFTVEDKLRIAEKLDWLGVHYIEAGWPGASPKDTEFFARARTELKLKKSRLVAFGSTRRAGTPVEKDKILNDLLAAETKTICIFGKTWDLHVKTALKIPLAENLALIRESVAYLKKNKREVIFDAEHFFDGFKGNKKYALEAIKAAASGGADRIVLCDTNGGTLPDEISKIVSAVRKKIRTPMGIHCHNDTESGVSNSIAAVIAGVTQVQGTINGIGERCGNANLCSIVANLELKLGYETIGKKRLERLRDVSSFVDELANRSPNRHQPYVGKAAFAHKGGVHVDAILKNSRTYEHIDPKSVGNAQRILLSELSGAATIVHKAKEFGLDLSAGNPRVRELLSQLKEMENRGYEFEGAEASFEMNVKKALGQYKPHFVLHDFKVTDTITAEGKGGATSEAIIHLAVDGHEETATAQGVGPVHALDRALRKALERFYPQIASLKLLDYKVRVLPAGSGTAATVRVLIECGDGESKWGTVGVSENIIHASYQALVDSIDFKLMKG